VEDRTGKICKGNKLYIKVPTMDDGRMRKITAVLDMFPGESQAILYFVDSGRRWGTPCAIYHTLVRELKELLGEENVVVK
jgi:DNA polymerase-3 subunit alpha